MSQNQPVSSNEQKKQRNRPNSYMKYSGMAIQMGMIILIGALIGRKIDAYFELQKPWGTIAMSLFSIFGALYLTIKDLLK